MLEKAFEGVSSVSIVNKLTIFLKSLSLI